MTREEIAQLMNDTAGQSFGTESHFQRFAALVAAAEREACAQIAEEEWLLDFTPAQRLGYRLASNRITEKIRERGKK